MLYGNIFRLVFRALSSMDSSAEAFLILPVEFFPLGVFGGSSTGHVFVLAPLWT